MLIGILLRTMERYEELKVSDADKNRFAIYCGIGTDEGKAENLLTVYLYHYWER